MKYAIIIARVLDARLLARADAVFFIKHRGSGEEQRISETADR